MTESRGNKCAIFPGKWLGIQPPRLAERRRGPASQSVSSVGTEPPLSHCQFGQTKFTK